MNQTNHNPETKFFNLTVSGLGFLNNPRTHSDGHGFSVTVQALRGKSDNPQKSRLDLDVKGTEALKLVKHLVKKYPDLMSKDKDVKKPVVFIGFTASDTRAETFESYGKTIASIKGRLLKIDFINIDGERLYTAPKKDDEITEVEEETPKVEVPSEAQPEVEKEPVQPETKPTEAAAPENNDPF
ncbi:DUF3577 domain-containing protein [Neisseria sp. Ec49-e6-T10]|uniref:DUF3577 domain-containing protein n=1 Tax=Neisseria sp. Ec49-e6-T10 TaxID=3140744 RepID=UPI003EB91FC9